MMSRIARIVPLAAAVAVIIVICSVSQAHGQNTVTITSPSGNPTWVGSTQVTVSGSVSGPVNAAYLETSVWNGGTNLTGWIQSAYNPTTPWFLNFTCPNPGGGPAGPQLYFCTVYVYAYDGNGNLVGTASAPVTIVGL